MFESYDLQNRLQFSADVLPMYLRTSGQTTVQSATSGINQNFIAVPTTDNYPNAIVAIRGPDGYIFVVSWATRRSNQRVFETNAPAGTSVQWYCFEPSYNIPNINAGLQIWNSAGQTTFASREYAMSARYLLDTSGGTVTFSGRSLAAAPLTFLGHLQYYNEELEADGWYFDQDITGYGFVHYNSGQQCNTANMNIFYSRIGPRPAVDTNAFTVNGKIFVVDVTNLPLNYSGF